MKLVLTDQASTTLKSIYEKLKARYPMSEPSYRAIASSLIDQVGAEPSDMSLRRLAESITPAGSKRKAWLEEIARLTENATPDQLARLEKRIKKLSQHDASTDVAEPEIQQN